MNQSLIIAALLGTLFLSESKSKNTSEERGPNNKVMAQEKTRVYLLGDVSGQFRFVGASIKTEKSSIKVQIERNALLLLKKGNDKYRAGKLDEAVKFWSYVTKKYPNTPAWNMAILNSGRVLQSEKRYYESISVFRVLLDSNDFDKLDKKEIYARTNSRSLVSAAYRIKLPYDPMDFYLRIWNNDWHSACSAVSSCYESLGMLERAHEYAVLSRDKYGERQLWGNARIITSSLLDERIVTHNAKLNKRIATLEAKIKKRKKPDQK